MRQGAAMFSVISMLIVALSGCRAYPVQPMPQLAVDAAPARADLGGARFGAKAYTNGVETKAVFNFDLLSNGFLPVLIIVDNESSSEVQILRARVELETPSGERLEPISGEAVATGAGRNALAEAIFFFGVFSYADANKYNDALVRDWVDKGFSEVQILRPGRILTRFLYFRVGQNFAPSGATLRVPFERDSRGPREVAVLRF